MALPKIIIKKVNQFEKANIRLEKIKEKCIKAGYTLPIPEPWPEGDPLFEEFWTAEWKLAHIAYEIGEWYEKREWRRQYDRSRYHFVDTYLYNDFDKEKVLQMLSGALEYSHWHEKGRNRD